MTIEHHNRVITIAFMLILSSIAIVQVGCINLPTDIDERDRISASQVFRAVVEATEYEISPLDNTYLSYTPDELRSCLEKAEWIRELPYLREYRDCDEFAVKVMAHVKFYMPGIAFGLVKYRDMGRDEIRYHMANIFIDAYLDVWVVDWKLRGDVFQAFATNWKAVLVLI